MEDLVIVLLLKIKVLNIGSLEKCLHKLVHASGNEVLYNGMTGEQLKRNLFWSNLLLEIKTHAQRQN